MQYCASMKTCTRCKNPKPTEAFAKRKASKDGLASWCKECFAARAKARYANTQSERDRINRNRRAARDRNQSQLREYLSARVCADCGCSDWRVLEFDHRDPEEKVFNVANMMRAWSWKNILREIEKCEVVCANCHRIRTYITFGRWRILEDFRV